MKTLILFSDSKLRIPASTAWYLDSLGQFRGKQELYTRQSPQRLRILREHAIIESAVSSNRIVGRSIFAMVAICLLMVDPGLTTIQRGGGPLTT
jgi:hypothetical protein